MGRYGGLDGEGMTERRKLLLTVLLLAVLFGSGAIMGITIDRLWLGPWLYGPPDIFMRGPPKPMVDQFRERLHLTPRQAEEIESTLEQAHQEMWKIRSKVEPQRQALIERTRVRISMILDDEQRVEFERMRSERRKWRAGWPKGMKNPLWEKFREGTWKSRRALPDVPAPPHMPFPPRMPAPPHMLAPPHMPSERTSTVTP